MSASNIQDHHSIYVPSPRKSMRLKKDMRWHVSPKAGMHASMSCQFDGIFSLVDTRISLASLVPSTFPHTRHEDLPLANDAEMSRFR